MSDVVTHLEAALEQARQELGTIRRAGRALTDEETGRLSRLQRVTVLVLEALDALRQPAEPGPAEAGPGRGDGRLFDERDLEMSQGGLAGNDDTDDY